MSLKYLAVCSLSKCEGKAQLSGAYEENMTLEESL
jgi:hypothetical protein